MYKLREQRLKEFYTTGEVLSDVKTVTPGEAVTCEVTKSSSYTSSSGRVMSHADSIPDHGFLSHKSKEIRDSESPTRDLQVFRTTPQTTWAVQTSSGAYQSVTADGQQRIQTKAHESNMSGKNDQITAATTTSAVGQHVIDRTADTSLDVVSGEAFTKIGTNTNTSVQRSVAEERQVKSSVQQSATSAESRQSVSSTARYSSSSGQDLQSLQQGSVAVQEQNVSQSSSSAAIKKESAVESRTSGQITSVSPEKSQTVTTVRIGPNGEKITETRTVTSSAVKQSQESSVSKKWSATSSQSSSQATSSSVKTEVLSSGSTAQQNAIRQNDETLAITDTRRDTADRSDNKKVSLQGTSEAVSQSHDIRQSSSTSQKSATSSQEVRTSATQNEVKHIQDFQKESEKSISQVKDTRALQEGTTKIQDSHSNDAKVYRSTTVLKNSTSASDQFITNEARTSASVTETKAVASRQDTSDKVDKKISHTETDITRASNSEQKVDVVTKDLSAKVEKIQTADAENWKLVSSTNKDEKNQFVYQDMKEREVTVREVKPIKEPLQPVKQQETPKQTPENSPGKPQPKKSNAAFENQPAPVRGAATPQEIDLAKGDVDYTTTYQSAFTPKRVSVDVSASHAAFASSLRAPSLSPERSQSPTKQHFNTPADRRSPTKSLSRGSLDRSSPTKPFGGQDRRSPTKSLDRQSPNKPVSGRERGSPTKSLDRNSRTSPGASDRPSPTSTLPRKSSLSSQKVPSPTKETRKNSVRRTSTDEITTVDKSREKRKLSSYSSRNATKKRSGTPRVSPSQSPVKDLPGEDKPGRQGRPRSRTSSGSSSSTLTDADSKPEVINGTSSNTTNIDSRYEAVDSFLETERNQNIIDKENILLRKLREKSPEYSSDGSLIQELYPGRKKQASGQSSPSSSPDRKGFLPIKEGIDTPDLPSPNTQTAPAPSPASPVKRFNGHATDSDVDTVKEKIKPIKPITTRPKSPGPRKSSASRSSSISPCSSPDRRTPKGGRSGPVSSSPSSSPERKSPERNQSKKPESPKKVQPVPVKKTPEPKVAVKKAPVPTTPKKKELTEYPSQRRFPDKENKPTTPRTSSIPRAATKPTSVTPVLVKKPSAKNIVSVKPAEKKPLPATIPKTVQRVPSGNRITSTVQRQLSTRNSEKSIATTATYHLPRKAALPKQTPTKPIPEKTLTPEKKTPLKPQNNLNKKEIPKSSPVRSAFARNNSRDKNITTLTKVKDVPKKPALVNGKEKNIGTFEDEETFKRTKEYVSSLKNVTTEVNITVTKNGQRNIEEFEFDEETPPNDFLVDDSSVSSEENIKPVQDSKSKKPVQNRTSSGPVGGNKPKSTPLRPFKQQHSEPKLQVSRDNSQKSITSKTSTKKTTEMKTVTNVSKTKANQTKQLIAAETQRLETRTRSSSESSETDEEVRKTSQLSTEKNDSTTFSTTEQLHVTSTVSAAYSSMCGLRVYKLLRLSCLSDTLFTLNNTH